MRHDIYTLPEISMVGGQSETIRWRLYDKNGDPYSGGDIQARFALTDFSDQSSDEAVLTKDITFIAGDEGVNNVAQVNLDYSDTANLYGKYVYQLTIKDGIREAHIPGQGIIFIAHNIDQAFLGE